MKIFMARKAGGTALIVTLLMLLVVLMLGLSGAQIASQDQKATRNDRDRQVALEAAEAALLDAERDIEKAPDGSAMPQNDAASHDSGPDAGTLRQSAFSSHGGEGFVPGCGAGLANPYLGLCTAPAPETTAAWQGTDFLDQSSGAASVPYGAFSGQMLQTGQGSLPARLPRYIIERLPDTRAGAAADSTGLDYFYRITAIGFGARDETRVVLQSFYRRGG